MDNKVLDDRIEKLNDKKFSQMSLLESLEQKSLQFILLQQDFHEYTKPGDFQNISREFTKLLIEAEEEEKKFLTYPWEQGSFCMVDLYKRFDKKLNAKIEEILNDGR